MASPGSYADYSGAMQAPVVKSADLDTVDPDRQQLMNNLIKELSKPPEKSLAGTGLIGLAGGGLLNLIGKGLGALGVEGVESMGTDVFGRTPDRTQVQATLLSSLMDADTARAKIKADLESQKQSLEAQFKIRKELESAQVKLQEIQQKHDLAMQENRNKAQEKLQGKTLEAQAAEGAADRALKKEAIETESKTRIEQTKIETGGRTEAAQAKVAAEQAPVLQNAGIQLSDALFDEASGAPYIMANRFMEMALRPDASAVTPEQIEAAYMADYQRNGVVPEDISTRIDAQLRQTGDKLYKTWQQGQLSNNKDFTLGAQQAIATLNTDLKTAMDQFKVFSGLAVDKIRAIDSSLKEVNTLRQQVSPYTRARSKMSNEAVPIIPAGVFAEAEEKIRNSKTPEAAKKVVEDLRNKLSKETKK